MTDFSRAVRQSRRYQKGWLIIGVVLVMAQLLGGVGAVLADDLGAALRWWSFAVVTVAWVYTVHTMAKTIEALKEELDFPKATPHG